MHEMDRGVPGLLSLVAAKYTTARAVAERAVDMTRRAPGAPARSQPDGSVTPLPAARLLDGTLRERVRRAVQEEMAHPLADVVLRRLDLGTAGEPAVEDLETVEPCSSTSSDGTWAGWPRSARTWPRSTRPAS